MARLAGPGGGLTGERRASRDVRADEAVLEGTRRRGVEGSRGEAIVDMVMCEIVCKVWELREVGGLELA